ncbi:hypothetical protein SANTM175S_08405 [Streptomyces antimycoticus]
MKAVRSAGVSRSSTVSSASPTDSSSVTRSSGPPAATTGSGSQGPTYASRRIRADPSRS